MGGKLSCTFGRRQADPSPESICLCESQRPKCECELLPDQRKMTDLSQRSLDRLVLIAWCGEGVPESRKGMFRESDIPDLERRLKITDIHMSQVQSKFLTGAHLVIQARSEVSRWSTYVMERPWS